MRGLEALTRRSPETEGVVEHSLYRTRGGAYVAVFDTTPDNLALEDKFSAMFLNKGSSSIQVSPGARLRYRADGRYRFTPAGEHGELDLFERVGYRVD